MINPTIHDVNRQVVYTGNRPFNDTVEEGVIISFNNSFVFVRYGKDTGAKATRREDLEWSHAQSDYSSATAI